MHVSIEFCLQWNYSPQAVGLTAELEAAYPGVTIERIESKGGVFEVVVDGRPVFSKKTLKRFPAYQEIPRLIEESAPDV